MAVTLDGQILFDEQGLEIAASSAKRDAVERAVAGLDGGVSIDLGRRSRVIKQKGVLRTPSQSKMDERIGAISAFIDGKAHTLIGKGGEKFEYLRMDSFKIMEKQTSGGGVCVDYEIVYTQLLA